jgi:hypothetical protein
MNPMIERVAKAIFDCSGYDDAINFNLEDWAPAARAAIAAMREPTEGMIGVANQSDYPEDVIYWWQEMINEALK